MILFFEKQNVRNVIKRSAYQSHTSNSEKKWAECETFSLSSNIELFRSCSETLLYTQTCSWNLQFAIRYQNFISPIWNSQVLSQELHWRFQQPAINKFDDRIYNLFLMASRRLKMCEIKESDFKFNLNLNNLLQGSLHEFFRKHCLLVNKDFLNRFHHL